MRQWRCANTLRAASGELVFLPDRARRRNFLLGRRTALSTVNTIDEVRQLVAAGHEIGYVQHPCGQEWPVNALSIWEDGKTLFCEDCHNKVLGSGHGGCLLLRPRPALDLS